LITLGLLNVQAKQYYTPLLGEKAIQYIFSMAKRRFKYSHANIVDFYGLCSFIDSQHRMASIVLTRYLTAALMLRCNPHLLVDFVAASGAR